MIVIGIGASAGGLEALSELLRRISPPAEIAILVVQHLDPTHSSMLVDLLRRATTLPVTWVEDGAEIESARVYVAPPNRAVVIRNGRLHLAEAPVRHSNEIDAFFRSLADAFGYRANAVVLSGNGADGALGVRAIKGSGGIVFAQRPAEAQFPSMPRAAIDTGCVDRVMTAAEIGTELGQLTQASRAAWERIGTSTVAIDVPRELGAILRLVKARTGVDFTVYKPNTIKRRVARRMMITKAATAADYLKLLQNSPEEIDELNESMLINVTEFFRDPECFAFIRGRVLPEIMARHENGSPIRVWVPGCATGEEAYTYGILLRELMEDTGRILPVQIFGTDLSEAAIAQARTGLFAPAELASFDAERRQRFFHQTPKGFSIAKPIRDMCVFARQNIFQDAPFSRLDILSCRNLLIYLSAGIQQKLIPMFHYALAERGVLVLGNSESVSGHADLFGAFDARFRVYDRRPSVGHGLVDFRVDPRSMPREVRTFKPAPAMPEITKDSFDAIREADRLVATRRGPPALLVNDDLDILQFRGDVMPYLSPVPGRATLKLLDMAREGLATELRMAVNQAREKNARVQRTGVSFMVGEIARQLTIEVTPFNEALKRDRFYLLEFMVEQSAAAADAPAASANGESAYLAQIAQLRQDLEATRSYLQSTSEKHESTNHELRAANEEIQSSNEELQSTNEELETAKEELQSANEELSTVNDELHHRHVELVQSNNDLTNLIGSVQLPILILGHDLTIRRFTPAAEKIFNLIASDVGRPLSDINTNLEIKDLARRVGQTIESLTVSECDVQDTKGRWYSMRLRPYKTADNKIEGVVVTLFDIEEMKRTMAAVEASRDFERAVFETTREPLVALDSELRIRAANRAFYALFGLEREQPENRMLLDATRVQGTFSALAKNLATILSEHAKLTDHRVEIQLPGGATAVFLVNARQIVGERPYPLILLSLQQLS
jgi:two-component system, chemotaxis family, CheB/CheR fusion protein